MISRGTDEIVRTFRGEGIEVNGPVLSGVPFLDRADMLYRKVRDGVLIARFVQSAGCEIVGGAPLNDSVLGTIRFITYLVGEDFGLVGARGWEHGHGDGGEQNQSGELRHEIPRIGVSCGRVRRRSEWRSKRISEHAGIPNLKRFSKKCDRH